MKTAWLMAWILAGGAGVCHAQAAVKPVGSVAPADADVSHPGGAALQMTAGRTVVDSSATVTAKPGHNADVALARGGDVLVCQTTALHLTAANDHALLLAIDRGAMELRLKASVGDVVMTPDMRFTMAAAGQLDLRMRVTFNGHTCVENRGRKAPALNISDAFGETAYLLKPGQHVMFEHGNLRTVEDHETTPCGCPPAEKQPVGLTLADALLSGGQSTPVTPQQAAAAHPFPEAVSAGLAQPAAGEPEKVGERHVQVSGTLTFDPTERADAVKATQAEAVAPAAPVAAPPAPPEEKHGPFTAIGHFFKRLFVR